MQIQPRLRPGRLFVEGETQRQLLRSISPTLAPALLLLRIQDLTETLNRRHFVIAELLR